MQVNSATLENGHVFQPRPTGERVNQLGGSYRNGKPLSSELRQKVIKMSMIGIRPCEISRRLKVTHGCISKLLAKFYKTGSLNPGHGTAGRPRVITPRIEEYIERYRNEQPGIFSWEIRERLLREGICDHSNLPSLSSISRLVKSKISQKAELPANGNKDSLSFSISNILSNTGFRKPERASKPYRLWMVPQYGRCSTGDFTSNDGGASMSKKDIYDTQKTPDKQFLHVNPNMMPNNKKRRIRFSDSQLEFMKRAYHDNPYPSHGERLRLCRIMGVDEARIQVWFSNKRAKDKRNLSLSMDGDCVAQHAPVYGQSGYSVMHCEHCYKEPFIATTASYGTSRLFFPPGYRPSG